MVRQVDGAGREHIQPGCSPNKGGPELAVQAAGDSISPPFAALSCAFHTLWHTRPCSPPTCRKGHVLGAKGQQARGVGAARGGPQRRALVQQLPAPLAAAPGADVDAEVGAAGGAGCRANGGSSRALPQGCAGGGGQACRGRGRDGQQQGCAVNILPPMRPAAAALHNHTVRRCCRPCCCCPPPPTPHPPAAPAPAAVTRWGPSPCSGMPWDSPSLTRLSS